MNLRYPAVDRLERQFGQHYRLLRDVVERCYLEFGDAWAAELDSMLGRLFLNDEDLALAVGGYAAFALDSLRRQDRFDKEGKYPEKTFAEATAEVYLNETYMTRQYLPGLLLSHYLWGHHYRQLRFFRDTFVRSIALEPSAFTEIGVGTGIYSRSILEALPAAQGTGFDISPYSKEFAEAHLARFGVLDRYAIELRDILTEPPVDRVRWLVCVEVLEHLDNPVAFLDRLCQLLAKGGKAFVTAALNAANADHIYLYRNAEEVCQDLRTAGFAIEQYFVGNAYKPAVQDRPVPSVAAFVVTRQHEQ